MRGFHANILWRLFLINSAGNDRILDGFGLFHALIPMYKRWSRGGERLEETAGRHMGYFNANPLMASYVVGAVVDMEEKRMMSGDFPLKRIDRLKNTLSAVLTARGDFFFGVLMIPLGLTIGAIFAIYSSIIGPLIFLALYNFFHMRVRIGGYFAGLRFDEVGWVESVESFFKGERVLGCLGAFASGVFSALVLFKAYSGGGPKVAGWGIASVVLFLALRRKLSLMGSVLIVFVSIVVFLLFR